MCVNALKHLTVERREKSSVTRGTGKMPRHTQLCSELVRDHL